MNRRARSRLGNAVVPSNVFILLLVLAACVLFVGIPKPAQFRMDSGTVARKSAGPPEPRRRRAGGPQPVSVEPMPVMEEEMCLPESASPGSWLLTNFPQEQSPSRGTGVASTDAEKMDVKERPPVRVIRDTYPTYSAVAVDTNSGDVYLQDENLFGFKVFNRLDNTPPGVKFTEPKRMVGGIKTKLEFNCALYVDPRTGDVYSVNNDMVDTMTVFPRDAQGNVAPKRELVTAHRTWGVAVDEAAEELFLTVESPPQVLVYHKTAQGQEAPIRMLEGNRTHLEDPHGIAIDSANQLMFVANHGAVSYYKTVGNSGEMEPAYSKPHAHGLTFDLLPERHRAASGTGKFDPPSITVYPLKATGDTPPLRIIEGPKTQLNWPATLYLDSNHGELYVANDAGESVLVFRIGDSGDVAPLRVIKGAKTGLKNPTGVFFDPKNDEVWVSNMGNHSATVYQRTANGDVAPLRAIRSAPLGKLALAIGNPGAVGYDSKREEILVPN